MAARAKRGSKTPKKRGSGRAKARSVVSPAIAARDAVIMDVAQAVDDVRGLKVPGTAWDRMTLAKRIRAVCHSLRDERDRFHAECVASTRQLGDALRERDAARAHCDTLRQQLVEAGKALTAAGIADRPLVAPRIEALAEQAKAAREAEAAATAKLRTIHGLSEPANSLLGSLPIKWLDHRYLPFADLTPSATSQEDGS